MHRININFGNGEENQFNNLKNEILTEIALLKALSDADKKEKNKDIISMIKYYVDMNDKLENRRYGIHNFTLQILAIWVAAGVLLATIYSIYSDKNVEMNSAFLIYAMFVIVVEIAFCFYSALIYERQTRFQYPFNWSGFEDYGNRWKWFYYADRQIQSMSIKTILPSRDYSNTIGPYLASYRDFMRKYIGENLDSEIADNIQQLHLLRAHNYYKNKFILALAEVQEWSVKVTFVLLIIGVIIVLLQNTDLITCFVKNWI